MTNRHARIPVGRRVLPVALAGPGNPARARQAVTKAPVLGTGAYTYEAIHDWGELPARIKWGNTHAVVEDLQGHIHVHHTVHATSESPDSIVVFGGKGKFVRSWGGEFRGVAHGMELRKEGRDEFLYLTAQRRESANGATAGGAAAVIKATTKGEIVWKYPGSAGRGCHKQPNADGKPKRYNPTNDVAIAPNGEIYRRRRYGRPS